MAVDEGHPQELLSSVLHPTHSLETWKSAFGLSSPLSSSTIFDLGEYYIITTYNTYNIRQFKRENSIKKLQVPNLTDLIIWWPITYQRRKTNSDLDMICIDSFLCPKCHQFDAGWENQFGPGVAQHQINSLCLSHFRLRGAVSAAKCYHTSRADLKTGGLRSWLWGLAIQW